DSVDRDVTCHALAAPNRPVILANAVVHRSPNDSDRGSPLDGDMQLDAHDPVLLANLDAAATRKPARALDLTGCVRRIAGEDFGGDRSLPLCHRRSERSTSSVASGRAAKRTGTNVVPSPGETCITAAGER